MCSGGAIVESLGVFSGQQLNVDFGDGPRQKVSIVAD